MSSFDLCALFGNALDNAIEATRPLDDDALREILLKVSTDRGLAIISLSNNFSGKLARKGAWFATTKKLSDRHGYGMDSMNTIVQKYNGAMSCAVQGNTFVLNLVIPLPVQHETGDIQP